MSAPGFDAMRADLVERGLIAAEGEAFRLTEAGDAYVDQLLEQLQEAEAPYDRAARGIRWNYGRRARVLREAARAG